jgi:tRNA(fMet)-specific endonuclease VapC
MNTVPSGKVLLDTNVVSYLMRGGELARRYLPHLDNKLAAISFITVGELYFGAEKRGWGELKRRSLEATLRRFVVIPYDAEIARHYGRALAERQRIGRPIETNDAWIAACASRHAIPLVTHNAGDFRDITSLDIISEQV